MALASGKDQGKVMTVLKAGQSTSNESKLAMESVEFAIQGSEEVVSGHRQIEDHVDAWMGIDEMEGMRREGGSRVGWLSLECEAAQSDTREAVVVVR